jgi:hypothetical protein
MSQSTLEDLSVFNTRFTVYDKRYHLQSRRKFATLEAGKMNVK